ncbi:hypothetical protein D1823_11550 [Ruegeria sp. AD91A]|uniref:hypothetical protein n=1 Tax=Ruegeria sp. AD91A TaxID=2293862 RepID=UPI000E4EEF47|nr:hypothetical protein [Ruegeria sp. AD91A]AXT27157.1 hypothetical protein D1823_11550 [Ruegeria sp. AD91A]
MLKSLVLSAVLVASASTAFALDRQTTNALRACHDYLWNSVPAFSKLPNAAISVYPGSTNGNVITVNWNVSWDQPNIRAAGNCTVIDENVEGFEDYTQ